MDIESQLEGLEAIEVADLDGDGVADAAGFDTDGDGSVDAIAAFDGDTGFYAIEQVAVDGSSVTVTHDPTGAIVAATFVDPGGAVTEMSGDGLEGFLTDLTDPLSDHLVVTPDTHSYDPSQTPFPLDESGSVTQIPVDPTSRVLVDDVVSTSDYEAWLDDHASVSIDTPPGADGVIGDVSDVDFWFEQSTAYTCAPAAATQIIEDFLDVQAPNEMEVSVWAAEHDLLTTGGGMAPEDLATVLTEFGVPSTVVHDQGWDDIAGYLAEGRSVVMTVDSGDYWGQDDAGEAEDSDTDFVDHAVRIVAIDTERRVAVLSDSGTPDGRQLEVPLEAMEEAWNDVTATDESGQAIRDRMLIVSDESDPSPGAVGEGPAAWTSESAPAQGETGAPGEDALASIRDLTDPSDSVGAVELDLSESSDEFDLGDSESGGNWFANPAGWVIVPVVLAASRIYSALSD